MNIETVIFIIGLIGYFLNLVRYLLPIWKLKPIWDGKKSWEGFDQSPLVLSFFRCLALAYFGLGTPFGTLIFATNITGVILFGIYITFFLTRSQQPNRGKTLVASLLITALLTAFCVPVLKLTERETTKIILGVLGVVASVVAYIPSAIKMWDVLYNKKVGSTTFESLVSAFFLSLGSLTWVVYGYMSSDPYLMVQYGVGLVLGIIEIIGYMISRSRSPT